MGSVNHGNQLVNYSFYDELKQEDWAQKDTGITPRGIYLGGYLTISSPTELSLSPLKVEIGDSDIQVSISTDTSVSITDLTLDSGTLDPATPYIVLRYAYAYDPNNFFEIHAVATPLTNDVVVGKVVGAMASIDYDARSEPATLSHTLRVSAAAGSGLYVRLHGGIVNTATGRVHVPNKLVGPFTPPTVPNSRIDLVYINASGVPTILQGTAAVSPVAPTYSGKLVLAQVLISNGITEILASKITDARAPYTGGDAVDGTTITRNVSGQLTVVPTVTGYASQPVSVDSLGNGIVKGYSYIANSDGALNLNSGQYHCQIWSYFGGIWNLVSSSAENDGPSGGPSCAFYIVSSGEKIKIEYNSLVSVWWKPIGSAGRLVRV